MIFWLHIILPPHLLVQSQSHIKLSRSNFLELEVIKKLFYCSDPFSHYFFQCRSCIWCKVMMRTANYCCLPGSLEKVFPKSCLTSTRSTAPSRKMTVESSIPNVHLQALKPYTCKSLHTVSVHTCFNPVYLCAAEQNTGLNEKEAGTDDTHEREKSKEEEIKV